mmetsp:Transcript_23608/g.46966  ORF Transcript_23608/g.46966 Transcript_23608/m.46966 type:complete len:86 (+) Transcript_23608:580-837(+)
MLDIILRGCVGGHTYFGDDALLARLCVCPCAHLTLHHTTCIELNFLEDHWGIIWWMIVITWAGRCLSWDRLVHLEMEYGGMSSLV